MTKHLIIDGNNLFFRALLPWTKSNPNQDLVVIQHLRELRKLIADHQPNKTHFLTDSYSEKRTALLPSYKMTRKQSATRINPFWASFVRQMETAFNLIDKHFPIRVVRMQGKEADDLAWLLCEMLNKEDEITIASSDSDLLQIAQRHQNVKIWHLGKAKFVIPPSHPVAMLKALAGDSSDDIPGVPGIGPKTAERILSITDNPKEYFLLQENLEAAAWYEKCLELVDLSRTEFSEKERQDMSRIIQDVPRFNETAIQSYLKQQNANRILESWETFASTFRSLE